MVGRVVASLATVLSLSSVAAHRTPLTPCRPQSHPAAAVMGGPHRFIHVSSSRASPLCVCAGAEGAAPREPSYELLDGNRFSQFAFLSSACAFLRGQPPGGHWYVLVCLHGTLGA